MNDAPRRVRRAARILLLDEHDHLLLIRFAPPTRRAFWCGVGGECDPGEDFHAAAVRELFEETGLRVESCGPEIARRTDDFITLEGEPVTSDERAVMLVGGDAAIGGAALEPYALAVLAPGAALSLTSEGGGRVMLLGGEAFTTQRHVWWNFVSSSCERIREAKRDWDEGRFPKVPGDEDDFIPLPKVPNTRANL